MNKKLLSAAEATAQLQAGAFDGRLQLFYGVRGDALAPYRSRIAAAIGAFTDKFGDRPLRVFSVSGRTELGGNHTDHQRGRVLAAGISLDILAVAAPVDAPEIRVYSEGFGEDVISLDDLAVRETEQGTSAALLRGTAARFAQLGKPAGGFVAYTVSDVLKGSGLSSSAAYEVMLGTICNDLFAEGHFSQAELAMIAQYAENEYFGKPCGLMDQMACALGTAAAIDFADAEPVWEQAALNLADEGYALCIIDSGADHADLTDEYAAIPAEMKSVAAALGSDVLRQTDEAAFWAQLPALRTQCGDRAVMRAIHFYQENDRVQRQAAALQTKQFAQFLGLVTESGRSSAFALQNIYASGSKAQQAVAVTLALCERLLGGRGACRVHGGGFAGTVQAYVPLEMTAGFKAETERVLGAGACHVLQLRGCGASALWEGETACC